MGRNSKQDTTWMLRWFFQEAHGQVSGLRSWWGPFVEKEGRVGSAPTQGQLRAAGRESDIAARLEMLTLEQRNVLALAFSAGLPLPTAEDEEDRAGLPGKRGKTILSRRAAQVREDVERFGAHPAVALLTKAARGGFVAELERRAQPDTRERVEVHVEGRGARRPPCRSRAGTPRHRWSRDDPREGLFAALDRGLVGWLRGSLPGAVVMVIRLEAAALVKAAVAAWERVAPKVEKCCKCDGTGVMGATMDPDEMALRRLFGKKVKNSCAACNGRGSLMVHDQRRRAAFGPVGQEPDDGDRVSGEVAIDAFCPAWEPKAERKVG